MAEEQRTYPFMEYSKPDSNETAFTIVPTGRQQYTQEQYNNARDTFIRTRGEELPGFRVITSGVLEKMRIGFEESVGQPLRSAATAVEGLPDSRSGGVPGDPNLLGGLYNIAKRIIPGSLRSVSTPEGFGSTVGTGAALAALGPASLPIKAATAGVGSILGTGIIGSTLQGGRVDPKKIFIEASIATMTTGATGLLKYALGRGVSQQAEEQVSRGLSDLFKTKYKHLTNDPNQLEMIFSTPEGAKDITQIGVKAILGDFKKTNGLIGQQIDDIVKADLTRNERRMIERRVTTLGENALKFLESVGDDEAQAAAHAGMRKAAQSINEVVDSAFTGVSGADPIKQQIAESVNVFFTKVADIQPAVELIDILKRASVDGFSVRNAQILLRDVYKKEPGSLLNQAGNIVGRGADLTKRGGIDRDVVNPIQALLNSTHLNRLLGLRLPPLGERYAGSVGGTLPKSTAAAYVPTAEGIRSFFDEERK